MSDFEREYFENRSSYGQRGGYDAMAASVSEFYALYFALASRGMPEIAQGAGKTALEVGCALGVGVAQLLNFGYEVYATDISSYAIAEVRRRFGSEERYAVSDAQSVNPFKRCFDLVASIHVVEHLPRIDAGIAALTSAVREGGYLLLATPNPKSISPYRRFQADPTHVNEHPPEVWEGLIASHGLRVASCKTFHLIPVVHRWFGLRYVPVPRWLGYDAVIVARRDEQSA